MIAINENRNHELVDVLHKVETLRREDYAAPCDTVSVLDGDRVTLNDGEFTFPMTEHAERQLCQRWPGLGTFAGHLNEQGHRDIKRDTLNELLQRDDRKMMVRTIQPNGERQARAFVSDAYKPIDDNIIVPEVVDVVAQHGANWRALGGQVTDTNSYLKFISREPQLTLNLNNRKRDLFIGFMYRNSEVGRGYTEFKAFFFDSYCENGCTFGNLTVADCKFIHRGSRIETDFGRVFEDRIKDVELASIKSAVVDATRLTCEARHLPKVRETLEASFTRELPAGKEAPFIRQVAKRVGLSDKDAESALLHYDGTANQFGVQAAITQAAQHAPTYEARQSLEEAGGKVLELSDRMWKSVAALV